MSFADPQAVIAEAEGVEPGFGGGMKGVEKMVMYTVSDILIHSKLL